MYTQCHVYQECIVFTHYKQVIQFIVAPTNTIAAHAL